MADRQVVFVAYPSRDDGLAATVMDAVRRVNALPLPLRYEPWPFNDVAGNPLVSPILEKIDDSPFVVADITYLNLNVVYEIGFAIGLCKRAFLVRHGGIEGDKEITKAVGISDCQNSSTRRQSVSSVHSGRGRGRRRRSTCKRGRRPHRSRQPGTGKLGRRSLDFNFRPGSHDKRHARLLRRLLVPRNRSGCAPLIKSGNHRYPRGVWRSGTRCAH